MNKRRLLLVAARLEKLPEGRFYYGRWVGENWKGREDLSCGTTACALGWATTLPSLRAAGLRLRMSEWGHGYVTLKGARRSCDTVTTSLLAACKVFGLRENEAAYLFLPEEAGLPGDASAKRVARHIREFVARGGMP